MSQIVFQLSNPKLKKATGKQLFCLVPRPTLRVPLPAWLRTMGSRKYRSQEGPCSSSLRRWGDKHLPSQLKEKEKKRLRRKRKTGMAPSRGWGDGNLISSHSSLGDGEMATAFLFEGEIKKLVLKEKTWERDGRLHSSYFSLSGWRDGHINFLIVFTRMWRWLLPFLLL